MAFLQSLEQVRAVNWAPKHLWDVKFTDDPRHTSQLTPPFTDWMPVSDVTIQEAAHAPHSLELYNQTFEIPAFQSQLSLSMTFYDSSKYEIFTWLEKWIKEDIQNNGQYITRLEKAVKSVNITKLNSRKSVIDQKSYLVFPKGELVWDGSSIPAAQQYSVSFVIVGSTR
jgi:hypothetical protein